MNIVTISKQDDVWLSVADYAENCSWNACRKMAALMRTGDFDDWERLFAAYDNGVITGFCALIKPKSFPGMEYTPLLKWLFVDEKYRGKRLSQNLIEVASGYAKNLGFDKIFLTTWHTGLYEKYGFLKICELEARNGYYEGIYEKKL